MAIAFEHHPDRHAAGSRSAGGFTRLLNGLSSRALSAWRAYRVERELESMSYDQRKDIGFRSLDNATR